MPITRIRLKNFKCFLDSGEIPLAPLTLVFGRNNTGKSTILQSLLLLRQSLDSGLAPRLNLRGGLYHAGAYSDIVHQHRSAENVVMEFGIDVPKQRAGELEIEFASAEPELPRLVRLRVRRVGSADLEIRRGVGRGGPYELWLDGELQGGDRSANFRFSPEQFFPLIGPEPPAVGRPSTRRESARQGATTLLRQFERDLRDMRTVSAFRSNPKRRYEFVGVAPHLLDAAGAEVVDALIEDVTRRGQRAGQLFRSVNRWLKAVGRVRMLPLRRISKTARIFEVRLKDVDSGRWANFADVGFGIGQALPVLVEGLRTGPNGLFIVQEPEIHLHPDAQMAMADFLINLGRSGPRVIAETHSEHLLLRVRHAVTRSGGSAYAAGVSRLEPDAVSIIYVDKTAAGESHVRRLSMDALGQIDRWPSGFMEEATRERIAIMREMTARRKARG